MQITYKRNMTQEIQLTKKEKVKQFINGEDIQLAINESLPSHMDGVKFLNCIKVQFNKIPELAVCDITSLKVAFITLAQAGLEPDGRRAHLIPRKNNKKGIVECQALIDYKGKVELAMRSGLISTIHADVICDNDRFDNNKGKIINHVIDYKNPRGKVYAAYATAEFKDGTEASKVMTLEELTAIRKNVYGSDSKYSPWTTATNEMYKKTAFHNLSKWLPLSPDIQKSMNAEEDVLRDYAVAEIAEPEFMGMKAAEKIENEGLHETKGELVEDDVPYVETEGSGVAEINKALADTPPKKKSAKKKTAKKKVVAQVKPELPQEEEPEVTTDPETDPDFEVAETVDIGGEEAPLVKSIENPEGNHSSSVEAVTEASAPLTVRQRVVEMGKLHDTDEAHILAFLEDKLLPEDKDDSWLKIEEFWKDIKEDIKSMKVEL